jgi:hypothetical protein
MMLCTPICSYPIIVTHLSFNFLCLLLLYSIYLNGLHIYTDGGEIATKFLYNYFPLLTPTVGTEMEATLKMLS